MPIETVRISKTGRDQLMTLKRRTGIPTWNVICRWAFCLSLAESTKPHEHRGGMDQAIEIAWKTFAGEHDRLYLALLKERCLQDGLELTDEVLHEQLRLHVHRGISYLAGNKQMQSIADLVGLAASESCGA